MNQWMYERINKVLMDEWMNEWMKKGWDELINKRIRINEGIYGWINERMNDWMKEWIDQ